MKYFILTCYFFALMLPVSPVFAQKYRTVDDTVRLNKEYVNLTNDIAEIKTKITSAEMDLPGYQSKSSEANSDAADAASASSDQADKATNGNMKDAKNARKKANKSYKEAKESKSAKKKLTEQEHKINRYKSDLAKKQKRLEKLDKMRSAIYINMQNGSIPK